MHTQKTQTRMMHTLACPTSVHVPRAHVPVCQPISICSTSSCGNKKIIVAKYLGGKFNSYVNCKMGKSNEAERFSII